MRRKALPVEAGRSPAVCPQRPAERGRRRRAGPAAAGAVENRRFHPQRPARGTDRHQGCGQDEGIV